MLTKQQEIDLLERRLNHPAHSAALQALRQEFLWLRGDLSELVRAALSHPIARQVLGLPAGERDGDSTLLKEFDGAAHIFAGTYSVKDLKSSPARKPLRD